MQLIELLLSFGQIHDGRLETTGLHRLSDGIPGGLTYRILFSSVLERDLVAHGTQLPVEAVEEIGPQGTLGADSIPTEDSRTDGRNPSTIPEPPPPPLGFGASSASDPLPDPPALPAALQAPREETLATRSEQEFLKVRLDILDRLMALAGELVLVRNQQLMREQANDTEGRRIVQQLDLVTSELQETILELACNRSGPSSRASPAWSGTFPASSGRTSRSAPPGTRSSWTRTSWKP